MSPAKPKTFRQRLDEKPTTLYALIALIIGSLGTGGMLKIVDRFFPDTRAAMESIAKDQALIRQDIESIKRAYWKQYGIKVSQAAEGEQ